MSGALNRLRCALAALHDEGLDAMPAGDAWWLDADRARSRSCQACGLSTTRVRVVYGEGNPLATMLIVGEGPGGDEDRLGRPFVGAAGRLLDEVLAEIGLDRSAVYITNVVKCRPPRNRDPLPDEIAACRPFLDRQIAQLRPRVIVALGRVAVQALIDDPAPITRIRGQARPMGAATLVPTFHPAYVLRNAGERPRLVEDLTHALQIATGVPFRAM